MEQLKVAKAKGTILQELKKIERTDLLILDDFGIQPFDTGGRSNLMDIIEDRHGKSSTLITSQIPVKDWYDIIDRECSAGQNCSPSCQSRIAWGLPEEDAK